LFTVDDGTVAHSAASEFLRADHPMSLASFALMFGQSFHWQAAGDIKHAITTGEAVGPRVFPDGGFWGYLDAHPAEGAVFGQAMAAKSHAQIADILAAHDFSQYAKVVDVGGGQGHLLRAILGAHADVEGVLFDLPPVIEEARRAGAVERLDFAAGDFFTTEVPAGDAIVLMEVLHDWDDEHCTDILAAVRRALDAGGRLLVIEIELPEGRGPDWAKLLDIVMLDAFGAKQRTNDELAGLLTANGFHVTKQTSTPGEATIIEAVPGTTAG
jgi:hypothetical protein